MPFRKFLKIAVRKLRKVTLRGDRFYCPICVQGYKKFFDFNLHARPMVICPGCASLERHRLLWAALKKLWASNELKRGGRLLHVAPEVALEPKFRKEFEYISIDLDGSQAMMAMDITALDFPDGHFDAIVCNHVLEHVPDSRMALAELFRVLKPGGWASIQVPMVGEKTIEDLSITDPRERERLFGQDDHVRQFGRDFLGHLEEAGFEVLVLPKEKIFAHDVLAKASVDHEYEVVLSLKKP